jgi:predicted small metal-binding protein
MLLVRPRAPTKELRSVKKRVDCECGWSLETGDEDELVSGVQRHATDVHQMTGVTREQVLAQAKPV